MKDSTQIDYDNVCASDPLEFDEYTDVLREMNKDEDEKGLIALTKDVLSKYQLYKRYTFEENMAAMRDLGMLISSIRKLKIQPAGVIPGIEKVLLKLSDETQMPPRDTAYHYGPCNPVGSRQRSFTILKDEWGLINGVRLSIPASEKAVFELLLLYDTEIDSPEFESICLRISKHLRDAIEGIIYAVKVVDPKTFSHALRAYFDPIAINGKSYIGPGGGQMPLYVFDKIFWMGSRHDEQYGNFMDECNLFMPPYIARIYNNHLGKSSAADIFLMTLNKKNYGNEQVIKNITSFMDIFKLLIKFRKPHQNLARRSLSKENRGQYTTGSAGYELSLVEHIFELTVRSFDNFKNKFDELKHVNEPR